MLELFYVDGFRSLKDFELAISPGLNVLVGPNGSGKTNIFRFFEFVSNVTDNKLLEAVGQSGGANAIFDRADATQENQKIEVRLIGRKQVSLRTSIRKTELRNVNYHYYFTIVFDKKNSTIKYDSQELKISESNKNSKGTHIEIKYKENNIHSEEFICTEGFFFPGLESRQMENLLEGNSNIFSHNSILKFLSQFSTPIREIVADIRPGKPYNINPDIVRNVEDIATAPAIKHDGSGLASTLSYLEKISKERNKGNELLFYENNYEVYQETYFQKILELISIVNLDIIGIKSRNDIVENRVNIFAVIRGDGREIEIPLNYLSDGTIKWLAIITAILTTSSVFLIEEPENFLHPKMQKEFVSVLQNFIRSEEDNFALLTTHSETLINCLKPQEIILTKYKDGYTSVGRISNPELITEEINRTGFGLGWYYNADILDA